MKRNYCFIVCFLLTVLGFTSCIDKDSDDTSNTYYGYVTIDASVGRMYPDFMPNVTLECGASTMKTLGLDKFKRVYLIYTASNSDVTKSDKSMLVRPSIVRAYGVQENMISERPDTLINYTGDINYYVGYGATSESQFFTFRIPGMNYICIYPGMYIVNNFLTLNYVAHAYTESVLACDSVNASANTAYLSLKSKNSGIAYSDGGYSKCYDMKSCSALTSLPADLTDSVTIVVSTKASMSQSNNIRIRIPKNVLR